MVPTAVVPCPLEALPCAAASTDSRLYITASNSCFLKHWTASGADAELLPGASLALLCRQGARSRFQRELSRHCSARQPFSLRLATPSVLVQLTPIQASDDAGWLVTVRDTPAAHDISTDRLLVASLVHDLKMPVQTVLGWVSLLRKKRVDGARLDEVLGILERNARLEADMLNELLEVACVRPTSRARTPSRVDLAELVRSMTDALRPLAEESGVQLHARGASTPVFVSGDAQDLTRVLGNLIANAIKFSERGGTVESRLSLEKGSVQTRGTRPGTRNRGALSALRLRLVPSRAPIAARRARRSRDWPRDGPPSRAASWRRRARAERRPRTRLNVYRNASALIR